METTAKKTLVFLGRVNALLARIASEGTSVFKDKPLQRELAKVLEGLRVHRFHRLRRSLRRIRRILRKPRPDQHLPLAMLLSDAHYASKLLKTHLKGRTDDPRIADDLFGKSWQDHELESLAGARLVVVGETEHRRFFVEIPSSRVLCEVLQNADSDSPAPPPRENYGGEIRADECSLYPGFPPERICLGKHYEGPVSTEALALMQMGTCQDYAALLTTLKEQMANVFAPRDLFALLYVNRVVSDAGKLAIADPLGNLLPVAEEEEDEWARAAALRWIVIDRKPEMVFGRLYLKKGRALFAPFSLIGEGLPDYGVVLLSRLSIMIVAG